MESTALHSLERLCLAACVYARNSEVGLETSRVGEIMDLDSKAARQQDFKIIQWHHDSPEPSMDELMNIPESDIFDESRRQQLTAAILKAPCTPVTNEALELIGKVRNFVTVFNVDENCLMACREGKWSPIE